MIIYVEQEYEWMWDEGNMVGFKNKSIGLFF